MILCNYINTMSPESFRNFYIIMCENKIIKLFKDKSIGLNQLLQFYNMNEIKSALHSILLDKNNNIYVPDQSKYSKILRYLEYGGENIKPVHLFSNVNKLVN